MLSIVLNFSFSLNSFLYRNTSPLFETNGIRIRVQAAIFFHNKKFRFYLKRFFRFSKSPRSFPFSGGHGNILPKTEIER